MFKISEFSKLSKVSLKTLRYYDQIGMLKPKKVDHDTGYRYYSADQLLELNRIFIYKELGFTLSQIIQLLREDITLEHIQGMSRTPVTRSNSSLVCSSWCQSLCIDLGFNDLYVSNLEYFPCPAAISGYSGTAKSGHCPKRKYFLHPIWFCTGIWIRRACHQPDICPVFELAGSCCCMHSFTSCDLAIQKMK